MSDDLELPRRGYDTEDVKTLTREMEGSALAGKRKQLVLWVLIIAAAAAIWLIGSR
jgi:hypothetical protein